jgi:phage terminase large subunit-like protein
MATSSFGKFPLKIPSSFKRRVFLRLLPSQEQILSLPRVELEKLLLYKEDLSHLIDLEPLRFFQPHTGAQRAFLTCWDSSPEIRVLLALAGNKFGKTTAGCVLLAEQLLGRALWGLPERQVSWKTPCRAAVFAEDFESHNETIVPNILSWFPRDAISNISRNSAGHTTEIKFQNGSLIHFKTFMQGSDTAEGKDWDVVWCDEPPPRHLYSAIFRGLVSTGGRIMITATLLKETWLYDEIEQPFVRCFMGSIHDNAWIDQAAKEAFLASLPPDERETREFGKPATLTGLIYKGFYDGEPFVIPSVELPSNCPYILGVDPHERRPVYLEWAFITPQGEVVWFDWLLVKGDTETILAAIEKKEREHPQRARIVIMDPNRGPARQINQQTWENVFSEAGFDVLLGQDNMDFGHTAMYNALTVDKVSKRPKMMWTQDCRGPGSPVHQMLRYSWDDWASRSRSSKSSKEKPRMDNKDFPDIHRYVAMEVLDYDQLLRGPEVLNRYPENYRPYGQIRKRVA